MAARGLSDAGAAPAEYVRSCASVERTNRRASVCLLARVFLFYTRSGNREQYRRKDQHTSCIN